MASQRRTPGTRSIPSHELLEVQCTPVILVRDRAGKIQAKQMGNTFNVMNEEQFSELMKQVRSEIAELIKMQK